MARIYSSVIIKANQLRIGTMSEFLVKYREPQHEEWEAAVADFSSRIPEIASGF